MMPPLVRAEGYRLLGLCFAYPDPDELRAELAATADAPLTLGAFAKLGALVDDEIEGEFNRLFSTNVAVPPCETSYLRTDKGARMGQLAALYDAFGTRSGGREHERPDYIGTQLEFASLVCLNEAIAEDACDSERGAISRDVHRVLAREHLGRWIPTFVERLQGAAGHPFYQAIGPVLLSWIQDDLATGGWSVEAVDERPPPDDEDCMKCPMAAESFE